jgi:hypothetical protein
LPEDLYKEPDSRRQLVARILARLEPAAVGKDRRRHQRVPLFGKRRLGDLLARDVRARQVRCH